MRFVEVCLSGCPLYGIQIIFAFVFFAAECNGFQCTVVIHGNTAVEQQVGVEDIIHSTFAVQHADMLLQFFAVYKGRFDFVHDFLFFFCQSIRVFRVYGGEIHVVHFIFHTFDVDGAFFKVNLIQQQSVFHMEFGMTFDDLCFHFPLQNRNGFMHFGNQLEVFVTQCSFCTLRCKLCARVIGVTIHSKCCQRNQVDTVVFFDGIQVGITGLDTQYVTNERLTSCRCPHPSDVMVPPLDVHRVIMFQNIHDSCRVRTSVVNIPNDMEGINGKALNQVAQGCDEAVCLIQIDDGADDFVIIHFFISAHIILMEQFFQYVSKFLGQCFSDFGTGIFGRNNFADGNQTVQGDFVPVVHVLFCFCHLFQFLFGIINQRCQRFLFAFPQTCTKNGTDLVFDNAGSVAEYMAERFYFPMNIRNEVLCPFRQVQNRLQVHNLCGCAVDIFILFG